MASCRRVVALADTHHAGYAGLPERISAWSDRAGEVSAAKEASF